MNGKLSKETIVDAKLYINNPAEMDQFSISLWVEYEGGIEFPVITRSGLQMFYSASTEFADSTPIELSDEFYKELVDLYHRVNRSQYPVTRVTLSHPNIPMTERWVLDMMRSMMVDYKVPFEIEWLIEEAQRKCNI